MIELPDALKPYQKVIGASVVVITAIVNAVWDRSIDSDEIAKVAAAVALWVSVFVPTNQPVED